MKKLLSVALSLLFIISIGVANLTATPISVGQSATGTAKKRGPVFRATKDQINQAQAVLKNRGFYNGTQTGKLDDATREGLKKYQTAESLKVTGTLNKLTLEKMGIELTEKQKGM
jgi:peptidoglycan hydrolase-like protein with peptidoglycan-binding domain